METLLHFTLRTIYLYDEDVIRGILYALNHFDAQGKRWLACHGIVIRWDDAFKTSEDVKKHIEDTGKSYIEHLKKTPWYSYYHAKKTIPDKEFIVMMAHLVNTIFKK